MPEPRQAKRNTASRGSRTGVRKRMIVSVPRIPSPRARLLPTAMINMHVTIAPSTIDWMKDRE